MNAGSRFSRTASVQVYKQSMLYGPFPPPLTSFTEDYICLPNYQFVFKDPNNPFVIKFPAITGNTDAKDFNGNISCRREQGALKTILSPTNKDKGEFASFLKEMVEEMTKISGFECGEDVALPGRNYNNVDVEIIIGYLRSLAYRYSICL